MRCNSSTLSKAQKLDFMRHISFSEIPDFLIRHSDKKTQLRVTHAYMRSAPSTRIKCREAPQFLKFMPTLGALFSVPVYSVVLKIYRTIENNVFYQKTPNVLCNHGFPRKKQPQTDLRSSSTSSKKSIK